MVALKSASSRCPIPNPLHQPALHYLSEGLMWSADLRKNVEQLQPLVQRVEVEQRDDGERHGDGGGKEEVGVRDGH